jgi:DNA-binding NarL/FixJ family response regulator
MTPSCHTLRLHLSHMQTDFTPKSNLSLLIADDHALLCEGLVLLFRTYAENMAAVGVAYQEMPSAIEQYKPDVIILGLGAKPCPSWSMIRTLCEKSPDIGWLILDDTLRTRNIRFALASRICGYWTKYTTFSQIVEAVHLLAAGQCSFCPEVDQYLFRTRHGLHYHPAHTGNPLQMLTPRETELFTLLAQGLTIKQCSERMGITVNTADNHKTRLMRKLGIHKTVELARLAVREGIIE